MFRSSTDMQRQQPPSSPAHDLAAEMRKKTRGMFLNAVWLGIGSVLLFASWAFAAHQRPYSAIAEERAVRALMSRWIAAYEALDAKQLAALEAPDVEIVDRFGELHLPAKRGEDEKLWSDTFEAVSRGTKHPDLTIDLIRLVRPDVAIVQVTCKYSDGILLVDGQQIPPFSQTDTFVAIKSHGAWLVAAHNMQEKKPGE